MKIFLIAGEASGDLHASHLMAALRKHCPEVQFAFLGGDKMAAVAGLQPVVHYRRMAYMGFSEVLRNLGKIKANLDAAKEAIDSWRPDCIVLVDYPSFNLKIASYAHELGIPVYYYISPKIWAWKQWRVRDIRRNVRSVLAILPFEPAFYAEHGARATYVGNPSVSEMATDMAAAPSRDEFLKEYRLPDMPIVALMPGSRRSEIRNNLPIMVAATERLCESAKPVIIAAPGVPDATYAAAGAGLTRILRVPNAATVLANSTAALVTSGTATLETALAGVPQVVMYRANGSRLSYNLMHAILDIDFVSLPNLICDEPIVPELLLHYCTVKNTANSLQKLLDMDSPQRAAQLEGYKKMRQILGTQSAPETAAAIILNNEQ